MLKEFAERLAEGKDFSEFVGREIGSGSEWSGTFPTDLDDTDHFSIGNNGGADNLLDGFTWLTGDLRSFKYGGMPCGGKVVVDLWTAVSSGASRKRGVARQGNEADPL